MKLSFSLSARRNCVEREREGGKVQVQQEENWVDGINGLSIN